MSLVTDQTQIKLISRLAAASSLDSGDLLLLQRGFKSHKINRSNFVESLVDNTTLEKNSSDKLEISNGGVTTAKIADNDVTFSKIEQINTSKVLGRTSSGSGNVEEIDIYDNDGLSQNSATSLATQQSIKAYVDNVASVKSMAIIEERQPNGRYCDGGTSFVSSGNWFNSYDPNNYTESINHRGQVTTTFRFFQRNLNELTINENSIVENFTSKRFRLSTGTYFIKAWGWADDQNYSVIRLKRHNNDLAYGDKYVNSIVDNRRDGIRYKPEFTPYVLDVSGTEGERTFSFEQGSNFDNSNSDYGYPYQLNGLDEIYFQAEIIKLS